MKPPRIGGFGSPGAPRPWPATLEQERQLRLARERVRVAEVAFEFVAGARLRRVVSVVNLMAEAQTELTEAREHLRALVGG